MDVETIKAVEEHIVIPLCFAAVLMVLFWRNV